MAQQSYVLEDFGTVTTNQRNGTASSTTLWNSLFSQVRTDSASGIIKPIDANGGLWLIDGTGINATGINPGALRSGFHMKGGRFLGKCVGKPIIDLTDSGLYSFTDTQWIGSDVLAEMPSAAVQVAIGASGTCGSWHMIDTVAIGSYSIASFQGYGYESCTMDHAQWFNNNPAGACFVAEGNPIHTYSSTYSTPSSVSQSFTNNNYNNCVFQPTPPVLFIIDITKANPAVVTLSAPVGTSLTNGQSIVIFTVVGMTQINMKKYTVANISGSTFQLQGIDSTGYSTYVSGGWVIAAQSVSTVFINRADNQRFNNCYTVNLGTNAVEFYENIFDGAMRSSNTFHFQIETFGSVSDFYFNVGSQSRNWHTCNWTNGSSALTSWFSTNAAGTGQLIFRNCDLYNPVLFGPNTSEPMLDQPSKYQFLGCRMAYPIQAGFAPSATGGFNGSIIWTDNASWGTFRK